MEQVCYNLLRSFEIDILGDRSIAHEEKLNLTEEEQTQDRAVWQSFNEAQGKGSG